MLMENISKSSVSDYNVRSRRNFEAGATFWVFKLYSNMSWWKVQVFLK
jgi:hypothetical protein